ncbi:MAG: hypothetical protein IJD71_05080 [Clostridia bacterium]|nr:hypothetical protein [Clostridia bacterium]
MNKKRENNDNIIVWKLGLFFIIACIYFVIILFFGRFIYPESLFFEPKTTYITAFINGSVIFFSSFLISTKTIKWFKKSNKKFLIVTLICIFLIYPVFFLKSGVVIDEEQISKKNIFGNSIESYSYSDIESFEISVGYGVQYDIVFNSKKSFSLCSHDIIFFNCFKNENNLQTFDKLLEEHAKRNVYKSIYSTSQNIKRFFQKNEYYNYFNQIFNPKTEDGSERTQGTVSVKTGK